MVRRTAMGLAGALALAGCGNTGPATPPAPCPRITILSDGADLTRFQPGAIQDLATTTFDARLVGFQASCDYARRREGVSVTLSAIFDVERGPVSRSRQVNLPWFIAVTDAGDAQLIDRQDFVTQVNFESNAGRLRVQSSPVRLNFPADERLVENHNVRISFQLTPDELALNRRRGPR
ncbi:hypothetical protein [Neoroseomonas oryzicola]|uniref:Uncharacterized protein n=1 Tax=Neoroseomonas oryzicola TaxID=535904 RepID=A0A9X9WL37_9PROT|nr:hypothetical protein [Neoroseomonas oryzicola]MBR0661047.1 hypothetical protein [Neoroseomonas oryzicola]NKE18304.1 hypothetical protein [Neoroseomonas oryzicola]